MNLSEIKNWLLEQNPDKLAQLWEVADKIRQKSVGDEVHLRGLIEISNYCVRQCAYCGINAENLRVDRYRMTEEEIMKCANKAHEFGYGTVVLQAGEDYSLTRDFIANVVKQIKANTPLAVTLSLGERPFEDLQVWKNTGADRYLLRFETSDSALYNFIHPQLKNADPERDRFAILKELKNIGYEVGSGIMIGIPGQTIESLAKDILRFQELDLDMIGVGPYISHPFTKLAQIDFAGNDRYQAAYVEEMTYKVIALTRIMCPKANIPSTTALASLNTINGRELGLMRGANIVMPNLTPPKYRLKYEIYPNKACVNETAEQCQECLHLRILSMGRRVGKGHGGRVL